MALPIWVEIVCGNCATTVAGQLVSRQHIPRRAMKEEALRNGWTFRRSQTDSNEQGYCKRCSHGCC